VSTLRSNRRSRRRAGFTLLELMTIVTIVLIMAAIVAPAAARTLAIYRAQSAASDLLMMARSARREAMESGRATVVRFLPGSGRIEVRRGGTSLCRATNWAAVFADSCASAADLNGASCYDVLDLADYDTVNHSVVMVAGMGADYDLCYQPNGEALGAAGDAAVFSRINAAPGAQITLERRESGSAVGPDRPLLFPFDSSPRSIR
jgi:type II secretory pathway pseudopilin PulG